MRQAWKGMVVGGLTGAAVGSAMDLLSERNLRRVAAAGGDAAERLGEQVPVLARSAAQAAAEAARAGAEAARNGAERVRAETG